MFDFNSEISRRDFMKKGAATAIGLAIAPSAIGNNKERFCNMHKVVLPANEVSGVHTLTQSMINQTNTIYVVQNDYVFSNGITIPENCILEFEGGSLTGNTLFLKNNSIIENGVINLSGQLHLNINTRLERCKIVRTTNMTSRSSIIVIKNNELERAEVSSNIKIRDCIIEYVLGRQKALARKGYAIELFAESGNVGHNSGYSNLSFDNLLIDGYFNSAFYIHTTGAGWITDVLCNYIIVSRAHNAFLISSDYKKNDRIQAIRITNSSIQGFTKDDGYFLDCRNARGIYVYGSIPWDWNDYVNHSAFKFYSNTGYVYIDNILGGNKNYDFVDLTGKGKTRNELIHIHSTSDYDMVNPSGYHVNGNGNYLGDLIDLSKDVKMADFIQLPEGVYYLPETHDVAQYLGLGGEQGGVLICRSEYNSKFIIYAGNVKDDYRRREIAFMAVLTNQNYNSDAYVKDYWIRPLIREEYYSYNPKRGSTITRMALILNSTDEGFCYYDTDLHKPVWWSGHKWKNADGSDV